MREGRRRERYVCVTRVAPRAGIRVAVLVVLQWYILAVLVLLLDLKPPPLGRTKIFPTPPSRGGVGPERFLAHGDAV